ncbi:hypothetical protein HN51_044479 [Arachis hypogaea]
MKSYPSNDVLPLQYYTNENQISGLSGVRNTGVLGYTTSVLLKVKDEVGEASKNPQNLLLEAIHSAGYSGALANPLLASESALNGLNDSVLEEFVAENYTAPQIVLAASGVEHEELLSIAESLLSDLPNVPHLEEPKSVYTGDDYRCHTESGLLKVKVEVGEASKNPQNLLLEAIHSARYSSALANPLLASESAFNGLNDSVLEEFVAVMSSNSEIGKASRT